MLLFEANMMKTIQMLKINILDIEKQSQKL
jgi:hypothetical protein